MKKPTNLLSKMAGFMLAPFLIGFVLGKVSGDPVPLATECISGQKIDRDDAFLGFSNPAKRSQSAITKQQRKEYLQKQISELEQKNTIQETLLDGFKHQLQAEMAQWPEAPPKHLQPDFFQHIVSQTLDQCELPLNLVGLDCHEPPCLAVLRLFESEFRPETWGNCPVWQEHYGNRYILKRSKIDCADSRIESIAFIHLPGKLRNKKQTEKMKKRVVQRRKNIESAWECLPPK